MAASAVVGGLGWSAASMGAAIPFRSSTFTLNHSTFKDQARGDKPTITGGVLTITNGGPSDANSSFYTTPLSVGGPFTASFVYQAVNPTGGGSGAAQFGADGITFTIETTGSTDGTPATMQIGGRGSGLGYGNNDSGGRPATLPNDIANRTAVELTDYQLFQTGIVSAGATGTAAGNVTTAGTLLFSDPPWSASRTTAPRCPRR